MPHRIVLGEHLLRLLAGGCRLALKQLEVCQQPAGERSGIGKRVTLGDPDRLAGVRSNAVELPADELVYLPAVQDSEDLLGVTDLLAQSKRTFEYPFEFGRRAALG